MACMYSLTFRLKNGGVHNLHRAADYQMMRQAADYTLHPVTPAELKAGDMVMLSLPEALMPVASELIEMAVNDDEGRWETIVPRVYKLRFTLGFQDNTTAVMTPLLTDQVFVFKSGAATPAVVTELRKGSVVWHDATKQYGRVQADPVLL